MIQDWGLSVTRWFEQKVAQKVLLLEGINIVDLYAKKDCLGCFYHKSFSKWLFLGFKNLLQT